MVTKVPSNTTISVFKRSFNLLSASDKVKVRFIVAFQIALAFLDLLGVALVGVLGALAVNGVASQQPGNRVFKILTFLQLDRFSFQEQAAVIGLFAALVLILRTFLSVLFVRRTLIYLSFQGADISSRLVAKFLSQDLIGINRKSFQETLFAITDGVSAVVIGILSTSIVLISDVALLVVLGVGLFVVDVYMALGTLVLFGVSGIALFRHLQNRAKQIGQHNSRLTIALGENFLEALNSFREITVANRRAYYAKNIEEIRNDYSVTQAEIAFMPSISKYVVEITVVVGAVVISAIQFLLKDSAHAIATLSVFMAAGTRIAPAAMRVQQGLLIIRTNVGAAKPTLDLIADLEEITPISKYSKELEHLDFEHSGFNPQFSLTDVSLTYPTSKEPALRKIDLTITAGEFLALVGPSGSGKTSLVDLLLGVIPPSHGTIELSSWNPQFCIAKWPGAVAYVPQDVVIATGTIRSNVTLGYPTSTFSEKQIWEALDSAKLGSLVRKLPDGLDTYVGQRGTSLSGGQQQRLGIARALLTKPKLLVLDEATSALDSQTEVELTNALNELKGKITIVMIAHRLSTIRNADRVIYLEQGAIRATGSFDQVRKRVPDFDKQAELMGL